MSSKAASTVEPARAAQSSKQKKIFAGKILSWADDARGDCLATMQDRDGAWATFKMSLVMLLCHR